MIEYVLRVFLYPSPRCLILLGRSFKCLKIRYEDSRRWIPLKFVRQNIPLLIHFELMKNVLDHNERKLSKTWVDTPGPPLDLVMQKNRRTIQTLLGALLSKFNFWNNLWRAERRDYATIMSQFRTNEEPSIRHRPYFLRLPIDVIREIFSYLALTDIKSLRSSLQIFKRLIDSSDLVKFVVIPSKQQTQNEQAFRSFIHNNEKSMSIVSKFKFEQFKPSFLEHLPQHLKSLDLSSLRTVTDESLKHLPPSLTEINLRRCHNVTDQGIANLIERTGRTLVNLEVFHHNNITSHSLSLLPSTLTQLSINNFSKHLDDIFPSNLIGLKHLRINQLPQISTLSCGLIRIKIWNLRKGEDLSGLTNLQSLTITNLNTRNRPFPLSFPTSLEELSIRFSGALRVLGSHIPTQIRSLSLDHHDPGMDSEIVCVSDLPRNLTSFTTPNTFDPKGTLPPSLTKLNISRYALSFTLSFLCERKTRRLTDKNLGILTESSHRFTVSQNLIVTQIVFLRYLSVSNSNLAIRSLYVSHFGRLPH